MHKLLKVLTIAAFCAIGSSRSLHPQACVAASQVTLTGNLRAANGLPASNSSISLTPTQAGFIGGCGVNLPIANACATSSDGSVVGMNNPTTATLVTTSGGGTLPSGLYYVVFTFYDALGEETLASPETVGNLSLMGSLVVNAPASGIPASAVGMNVYISLTSGAETKQGSTTGTAAYTQSSALVTGAALPASNNTQCHVTANDSIWPVGTGYKVSMVDSDGNAIPGYPMTWQLMGAGSTINLSNGLPYYNGVVTYPVPLMVNPFNHGTQSIGGPLSFGGYSILNAGKIGVGTATPGWPVDVENGPVNALGYIVNGGLGVTTGNCLLADSDAFHTYRVPGTCLTSIGALNYQTVDANGMPLTPRAILNFAPRFAVSDTSPSTTVDLAPFGTAGTFTHPVSISIDSFGRVASVTTGSVGVFQDVIITSGICTTAATSYATCTFGPISWPSAFADTNYTITCMGFGSTARVITGIFGTGKSNTGFSLTLQNGTADGGNAASLTEIDCHGSHL